MGADGTRTPEELTATAAGSGAGAGKEGVCAARRLFRAAVPRPLSGPARCLRWPRRCLRDWRLRATANPGFLEDERTWKPPLGASDTACFINKWSLLLRGQALYVFLLFPVGNLTYYYVNNICSLRGGKRNQT